MANIKISELSIGDWVRVDDTSYLNGKAFKIIAITHKGFVNAEVENASLFNYDINRLSPIPLTPEILEKNGFEKDEDFICHSLECDEADFVDYTIGMNRLYIKSGRCDIALTIKYVHQLQHALRLAGVGKEIEV